MGWTPKQEEAITSRDQNLLVAAAAGSGKTSVLVERIVRRILDDGIDIHKLLVVTFTKAAAAEMRARVGKALAEAANDPAKRQVAERQLLLLNSAHISTLHSFCQSIIRQYFYRLELDPGFRLGSDTELKLLQAEVLEGLFAAKYDSGDEAFYQLVNCYSSDRDDRKLASLVLRLYSFSRSHPWPSVWLDTLVEPYRTCSESDIDGTDWAQLIQEKLAFELEPHFAWYEKMADLATHPGNPYEYHSLLVAEREQLRVVKAAFGDWRTLRQAMNNVIFERLPSKKMPGVSEEAKELFKKGRDRAKEWIRKVNPVFFDRSPEDLLKDMRQLVGSVSDLVRLVQDYDEAFAQAKRAKGIIDYNDLEHFTLQILRHRDAGPDHAVPSAVALELREKFAEVLVDEYQDTNEVQESIINLITSPDRPNRFMVGDVKQSIYRFRLAEPGLFLAKYQNYSQEGAALDRRIDLSHNFRSDPTVLHGVNFLFRQLMTAAAAEMNYGIDEYLNPGAEYPRSAGRCVTGPVEVMLLDLDGVAGDDGEDATNVEEDGVDEADEGEDGNPDIAELSRFEQEARLIARRIVELKEGNYEVFDKDCGFRPIQWRDIVILLRAVSNKAAILLDAFREYGIPAYAEQGGGYFGATEVQVMLSLLNVIDNPRQDIYLAAVLRSPLVGLKAAQLAEMRLAGGKSFLDAMEQYRQEGENDALRDKLANFADTLAKWRTQARRRGVAELIWQIFRDTGYYDYVGGLPGRALRQANLRALYDRARQYEATNFRGLFRFLRFIDRLKTEGADLAMARALGESEDVVRIMTIHKSKGLEFPVVFVADLGKDFNLKDTKAAVLCHKNYRLGLYRHLPDERVSYATLGWHAISHKLAMESRAEELRILYVALTRAREKLILVGTAKRMQDKAIEWCYQVERQDEKLPDGLIATASNYLDWLGPALVRHLHGQALREYGACETSPVPTAFCDDQSAWDIKVYTVADFTFRGGETPADTETLARIARLEPVDAGTGTDFVAKRLQWQYNCTEAVFTPAKLSVSEIKRRFQDEDTAVVNPSWHPPTISARPAFIQAEGKLTAAEYGTIMHTVMQHIDIYGDTTPDGIVAQLDSLMSRELLLPEQVAAIDARAVALFYDSALGRRMKEAAWHKREMAFSLMVPAERYYPNLAGCDEKIFIQGIADCLFADGDGLVLIDYKTDRVKDGAELVSRYRVQLELYAEAIEKILGKPVKEIYLYVFSTGEVVPVDVKR